MKFIPFKVTLFVKSVPFKGILFLKFVPFEGIIASGESGAR